MNYILHYYLQRKQYTLSIHICNERVWKRRKSQAFILQIILFIFVLCQGKFSPPIAHNFHRGYFSVLSVCVLYWCHVDKNNLPLECTLRAIMKCQPLQRFSSMQTTQRTEKHTQHCTRSPTTTLYTTTLESFTIRLLPDLYVGGHNHLRDQWVALFLVSLQDHYNLGIF